MGKVRIKTLGDDSLEEQQKKIDADRRAKKRAKKRIKAGKIKAPGGKGGERIKAVGPTEEELKNVTLPEEKERKTPTIEKRASKGKKKKKPSKRHINNVNKIDRTKLYGPKEAIKLVLKTSNTQFKGSVEAHMNLRKKAKELNLKNSKKPVIVFENKFPLAHAVIGKASESEKVLLESLERTVKHIGLKNITKLTLSSTMGPGIKVAVK